MYSYCLSFPNELNNRNNGKQKKGKAGGEGRMFKPIQGNIERLSYRKYK